MLSICYNMVNRYGARVTFKEIEHQLQGNIFRHFLIIALCKTFIELRCFFNPLKTIYSQNLSNDPSIQIICMPII